MKKPQVLGELAHDVRRVVAPVVAANELYLEDVRVIGQGTARVVRVTVDLPDTETGALGTDQLGVVSRAISTALDNEDIVSGSYALEVSSPGALRPLTEARHYRRVRGRLVQLTMRDGRQIAGRLVEVGGDPEFLTLDDDGSTFQVALGEIKTGQVTLEMAHDIDFEEESGDLDGN